MGVFLHHIVEHYDSLANLTAFVQSDLGESQAAALQCLRPNATWAPLSSSYNPCYFQRAGSYCNWPNKTERGVNILHGVRQCSADYLSLFGLGSEQPSLPENRQRQQWSAIRQSAWRRSQTPACITSTCSPPAYPCPGYYIQNNFVVSRRMIHRIPRAVWAAARQLAMRFVFGDRTDEWHLRLTSASAAQAFCPVMEQASPAIFGAQPLQMRGWTNEQWCSQYRPNAECPASPCITRPLKEGERLQYDMVLSN